MLKFGALFSMMLSRGNLYLVRHLGALRAMRSTFTWAKQPSSSESVLAVTNGGIGKNTEKSKLAESLAFLVEESSHNIGKKPNSRMELKRCLELRIKKRVKEQCTNGKFKDLMNKVICSQETLQDAYNCIRLNSNIDITTTNDNISFQSFAEELASGKFDVNANTFSVSTRDAKKEVLVLPGVKLRVVQEAIRIILEVVYKPHFSKISHGCRSGRGYASALKYISKEVSSPNWWFTLLLNKKVDACVFEKLISILKNRIDDCSLYAILHSMYCAQVLNFEFGGFPKGHGLPQEGILSPILMNIYLDAFDHEFYRISMRYEALSPDIPCSEEGLHSKLRGFFRRRLKEDVSKSMKSTGPRVYCCRFMDEIFFAVSGCKQTALRLKSEVADYLQTSLHLDIDSQSEILPCEGRKGLRFLGTLVRRSTRESPSVKTVHKLKEKVKLLALQNEEAWMSGTVKFGKKWLGHGLKKVKESEIRHLANGNSTLSKLSAFRKAGMETDHWYKVLLKVWMQDIEAQKAGSEDFILSKYVAEPALPQELIDSFYKFQECAEQYIASETAATLALLPISKSATESVVFTEIIAPLDAIKKRLIRYRLVTYDGYARMNPLLVLQDNTQIVNWFSGIVRRWLVWYKEFSNFREIKHVICHHVRKSCIRTLAAKHRIHEDKIEKLFDTELSRIPSTQEIEQELESEMSDSEAYDSDEALMYGISSSGLCLLSLARMVSQSRPCNCFIVGCSAEAPSVFALHVMERQKFPGWKTGFSSCIHPSLNKRRIGLCKQHLNDLYLGHISLQSIDFGAWR